MLLAAALLGLLLEDCVPDINLQRQVHQAFVAAFFALQAHWPALPPTPVALA